MRIRTSATYTSGRNTLITIFGACAALFSAAVPVVVVFTMFAEPARAQRVFGLDTSSAANASAPSQTAWNNAFNDADGDGIAYKFAFLRANHSFTTDDPQFYTNITRATTAGLLAGSYDFVEPDLHTAVDDANHYLAWAGMYMKPGYLLPVLDLEHGNGQTQAALTTWALDFISTIETATGIVPIVYSNSSYADDEVSAQLAWFNSGTTPKSSPRTYQWLARPGGSIVTGEPVPAVTAPGYPNPYGVWDPNYITRTNSRDPAVNPWAFWQNGNGSPNGFLIDHDAANGNIEFVRDFLVPALWTNAGSGDWGTIANWNSDNPGYVAGNTATGPAPRLPAYDDTNATLANRRYDWVKLQNAGDGTVTISSGAQAVRKLYTQQPLNITGGSLSVAYVPGSGGLLDVPSEFNAVVTLSSGAAYSAHTTQVDGGGGQFSINGGTVTFSDIQLASHASNSGKIVMNGSVTLAQTGGAGTSTIRSIGSLAQAGSVTLSAGNQTFNVNNGSAGVDLQVRTAITGTGRLVKAGAGTMLFSGTNTYSGGTTISSGVLDISADNQLGTVSGSPPDNIVLDGGTLRTGGKINSVSLTSTGSGYTSFPTVSIGGAGADSLAASANVLAGVGTIAVTNGGSGYVNQSPSSPPTANTAGTFVDIVGGGGTGATAYATVAGGVVTSVTIFNSGSGYTSMPTINISSTGIGSPAIAGSGATASVSSISLQSITLNDGGFDYTTPTISITGGGGSGATGGATSNPFLTLNSNRGVQLTANGGTLYQTAGSSLTIGGVISSTGSGALTKSGAGSLLLTGTNTYMGNTNVNSGVLQYSTVAGLGSTSNIIVFNGGTLQPFSSFTDPRNVTLNAGGGTINAPGNGTYSGVFSGTGTLTRTGSGTLILSNDNTYTGATIISSGTLQIGNNGTTGSLVSSSIVDNGGVAFSRSDDYAYSGVISGTGTLTKLGGGTLSLTGANTYSGATTVTGGRLQIGNGGTTGSISNAGGIVNNSELYFNRSNAYTYGGVISGVGTLYQVGAGTLTLTGANTYVLGTVISNGVLEYSSSANLGSSGNSIIFLGGTLRTLAAGTQTRPVFFYGSGGTIDTNGFDSTFSGPFHDVGNFTKIGAGTLTLSGAGTISGATTVSAGTLTLSGAVAKLGTGNVAVLGITAGTSLQIQSGVNNGIDDVATLSLLGGGAAGVADQGYADLGSGIIETVASLLLGGVAQIPGTYGSTTSGAMFQNNEYFAGTGIIAVPALGDYNGDFKANAADYVTWRKDGAFGGVNGYETWRENFDQSAAASPDLSDPTAVPEPTSVALLLLGIGAMMIRRRVR